MPIRAFGAPPTEVWTTLFFGKLGILSVDTNVTLAVPVPCDLAIDHVRAYAKTAPGGDDLILDINKNGITLFTTQANRPVIPDGSNLGPKSAAPDIAELHEGDVLTLDVDQVGSGIPGEGLSVEVVCKQG